MNDVRFDELSRALSEARTRRQALKLFGLATAGGFATLLTAGKASATPGRCFLGGHQCREHLECCSKFCDALTATCACPPGTFECPSTGICVGPCGPGQAFNATTCACECPTGTQSCGDTCCAEEPAQVCVSGQCCTNPVECQRHTECCPGYFCTGGPKQGPGVCAPLATCTNPATCTSSFQCCPGFVCAAGGVCVPE